MKKVLIVDDTPIIRTMLKHFLKDDYILDEAANADDAFAKVATFKPDAVLLDIQMPGSMNGNDLCKVLKSHPMFKHIYILMLTADWRTVQKEGDEFAADDYTFKPFYGTDIVKMLKAGLESKNKTEPSDATRIY